MSLDEFITMIGEYCLIGPKVEDVLRLSEKETFKHYGSYNITGNESFETSTGASLGFSAEASFAAIRDEVLTRADDLTARESALILAMQLHELDADFVLSVMKPVKHPDGGKYILVVKKDATGENDEPGRLWLLTLDVEGAGKWGSNRSWIHGTFYRKPSVLGAVQSLFRE
jgi:hypothetical protein